MSTISAGRIFLIALVLSSQLTGPAEAGVNMWTSNGPLGGRIEAIGIDPITPSTLYAGTHLGGVFKSTDSGASWSAINIGLTTLYIHALAIDPITPSTLYTGTSNNGVFKSSDSGTSWSAINNGLSSNISVDAIAIDPITPSTLYAGTYGSGVFTSMDGGASWSAINIGLTNTYIQTLAIDPITPNTLYAGTEGGGVFKSTDSGASWSAISNGLTSTYTRTLAIDPITPNTLYIGTNGGVFKSTDGGASWNVINNGLTYTAVPALAIDPITPNTLYAGTGGGVFKSTDSGASWSAVNNGLTSTYIPALAIDPITPSSLYAGTNGGVFKSTDGGASWSAINIGLIASGIQALAIDPITPSTLYAGTYGGVFKSTNSGASWSAVNNGLTITYIEALAIDPITPSTLYAGTRLSGVFKSTDGGDSWSAINNGLTRTYIFTLAIDPITPNTLYAGTPGVLFKSTDGGASWSAINNGLTNTYIHALAIDLITPSTLYAGTWGSGVFKSTDSGANWNTFNNGLTNTYIEVLAIDPVKTNTLYAGTYGGVFDMTQGTEICGDPNSVVQDQIFPAGSFVICTASQSITTQGMVDVQTGANVTFVSPSIQLNAGFSAEAGSIFRALKPVVLTSTANANAKSTLSTTDRNGTIENEEDLGSVTVPSSHRVGADELLSSVADMLRNKAAQVTDLFMDDEGRYVVFSTEAGLSPIDENRVSDIYLYDVWTDEIRLVSQSITGGAGNGASSKPRISATGDDLVFQSNADDLVVGDTNDVTDIFLHGVVSEVNTRVSWRLDNTEADRPSLNAAIGDQGRRVLYDREDDAGYRQVFGIDRRWPGEITELLSFAEDEQGHPIDNHHPGISPAGRYIVYLETTRRTENAAASCHVHVYDTESESYVRRHCPERLDADTDATPIFSEDGGRIEWVVRKPGEQSEISGSAIVAPAKVAEMANPFSTKD